MGTVRMIITLIVIRSASCLSTLLLQSEIHVPCRINVLMVLSVKLVLLDIMSIVVKRVSNSVNFTINLVLDLEL